MSRPLSPDLREALLGAADDLLYTKGIASTGVDGLCKAAGVGKPVLYRHFGSKDGVVLEYLRRRQQRRRSDLDEALARAGDDPHSRVLAVVDWMCDWIRSEGFRGCSFLRALSESSIDLPAVTDATAAHKQWVQDLLATELDPLVAEPRATARHLFFLIEGAATAATYEDPARVADDLRSAAELVLAR